MDATHRESAESVRALIAGERATPDVFRAALLDVPAADRDAWLDLVFALDEVPDDGPWLPRGCVPNLPCSVDALLRVVEAAEVRASDVFVDVGSGVGRAATLVHLLTGAAAVGLEIQPALVDASRDLTARLNVARFALIRGDAARLTGFIMIGTVFFLYCPFSGERLEAMLDGLEPLARAQPIRICCVDLPLPSRPWLARATPDDADVVVYRSTLHGSPHEHPVARRGPLPLRRRRRRGC